jgi:hypothetical protein
MRKILELFVCTLAQSPSNSLGPLEPPNKGEGDSPYDGYQSAYDLRPAGIEFPHAPGKWLHPAVGQAGLATTLHRYRGAPRPGIDS